MSENRICLGAIVGVHGIKGEVKVKSFTAVDSDIDKYGVVEDEAGVRKFNIKVVGHSKELLRVKVKGVEDRNAAEALVGVGFYVDRNLLPELEEEEFYHTDLIGLVAKLAQSGEVVGEVMGVYNFGAGDLLEIKIKETQKTELIPFNKQFVPEINITNGYIIIEAISLNFAEDESNEG